MSWFKIIDPKTGRVLHDSRLEELDDESLGYISQLDALKPEDDHSQKMLAGIREAAIKREHSETNHRNIMRRRK